MPRIPKVVESGSGPVSYTHLDVYKRQPQEDILKRIDRTVADYHIEDLMGRSVFALSGGEKQKIACASSSVLLPGIMVLDEPSSNLRKYHVRNSPTFT